MPKRSKQKKSEAGPMQHRQIAEWLVPGGRRVKIRCVIESCVSPRPTGIVDSTEDHEGVFWEVRAAVGNLGVWGRSRTIDEAFSLSLEWLVSSVTP